MKRCNILYSVMLIISIAGCKAPQNEARTPKGGDFSSYSRAFSIDASELSSIIPPLCEDLGVTIEDTTETLGQYKVTCKSIIGRDIAFEAVAIFKDKTLLRITAQGRDDIGQTMCREIGNRMRHTIDNHIKAQEN